MCRKNVNATVFNNSQLQSAVCAVHTNFVPKRYLHSGRFSTSILNGALHHRLSLAASQDKSLISLQELLACGAPVPLICSRHVALSEEASSCWTREMKTHSSHFRATRKTLSPPSDLLTRRSIVDLLDTHLNKPL